MACQDCPLTRLSAPLRLDQGTEALGVSSVGEIAGFYADFGSVLHGFVRAADGTITEFDAPDAGTSRRQGTICNGINAAGVVVGYVTDSSSVDHCSIVQPTAPLPSTPTPKRAQALAETSAARPSTRPGRWQAITRTPPASSTA